MKTFNLHINKNKRSQSTIFIFTFMMLLIVTIAFQVSVHPVSAAPAVQVDATNSIMVNTDNTKGSVYIYDGDQKLHTTFQNGKTIIKQNDLKGNLIKRYVQADKLVFSTSNASISLYIKANPTTTHEVKVHTRKDKSKPNYIETSATKLGNGVWKAVIPMEKYLYGEEFFESTIYINGASIKQLEFKVVETVQTDYKSVVSLKDEFIKIQISGVASTVSKVEFPTWTIANGQDDLKWIQGQKIDHDKWEVNIPFSGHNYELGSYVTHIYSHDKDGNERYIAGIGYEAVGGVKYPAQSKLQDLSHDVYVYGVDPNVKQVEFPTWTLQNEQDDIEWIQGEKVASGVWKGTVVYKKHKDEVGTYVTHVYGDKKGIDGSVKVAVDENIKVTAPQRVELKEGHYQVRISGLSKDIKNVYFPTWTDKNGQDDLLHPWAKGIREQNGDWVYTVDFRNHNYESGKYHTHGYSEDKYGNTRIISITEVHAEPSVKFKNTVRLDEQWYDLYVYGVDHAAKKVEFPTWTAFQGQDDIKWIQGEKISEGVWRGRVKLSDHNNEKGIYHNHIYIDQIMFQAHDVQVK
ncbi:GBS Bsp-like repeat-containing protein [Paenibacillus agilis]|uniref:Uncharacterized protein n=1 Tax=Paenibacillus agilis TaxID=3020863 RepID=A0A559IX18_9BACL|nr:GBS Bsp-like repeat-containing protein [Paenibacillus agilis]TVX92175.1 hypothetical protein FPZ44_03355 [Paenibacillus agilis]